MFAGSRTHVNLGATRTIKATRGLHIYGIVIANDTGSTDSVTFTDASGSTLLVVRLLTATTMVVNIPWLADNGLLVSAGTPSASMFVTVFHSSLVGST
jgi:hypothetical protein